MAETRLTNATFDTEVFSGYTIEKSIYKSKLFRSGIVQVNPTISALLAGGGESYSLPFWQDIGGTSADLPIEGTDATVNALTSDKQTFRKQTRNKVWGTNDLVPVFAGSDPLENLAQAVIDYWAQAFDIVGHKSLQGVIAENIANESSSLVKDISSGTGSAAYFSDNGVIDAQALLGENGMDFAGIVVHPNTYAYMRKLDLIDYVPVSAQERPLEMYMGMQVIVDRNSYVNSTVYDSYIVKSGALQFGQTSTGYLPTETDRKALDGFGIDLLITRRVFAMHPLGFQHLETGVAGISPTDAELAAATCWDRAWNKENLPIVVLRHKLG